MKIKINEIKKKYSQNSNKFIDQERLADRAVRDEAVVGTTAIVVAVADFYENHRQAVYFEIQRILVIGNKILSSYMKIQTFCLTCLHLEMKN